jgi:Tfp pilus assembly protein PilX
MTADRRHQRGLAALTVTLLLSLAMLLAAVFVNRDLLFEQRSATNQYRASQAFEAAEAGLEWALAQLNNPQQLDANCIEASTTSAGTTAFRTRYLQMDRLSGRITPLTWASGMGAQALRPSCVRSATEWACSCPSNAAPVLPTIADTATAQVFAIEFVAVDRPSVVRIVSTGCTRASSTCPSDIGAAPEGSARVEAAVALVPALATLPVAPLTAHGAVTTGAALALHNTDPDSGIAIDAGGPIAVPAAQLTTPAGAGPDNALVANDAALAATPSARLFAQLFGIGKAQWKSRPGVTRIDCTAGAAAGCTSALLRAIGGAGTPSMVWVEGDLALDGPIVIGSPERPVAVVASGAVRLVGDIRIHGVLYGSTSSWNRTSATGALLRGALISESGYDGDGTPSLIYDRPLLEALRHAGGSFVRVGGSWRDF